MNNELTANLSVYCESFRAVFKYTPEKGALVLTEYVRKGYFNAPESGNPERAALSAGLCKAINEALDTLSPREQRVIAAHFFTDPEYDHRLYYNWHEYFGEKMGVSAERVRQIEAKALRKLRHPTRSEKLKTYVYDDEWL